EGGGPIVAHKATPTPSPSPQGGGEQKECFMLIANAPCSWGINYPTGNACSWRQYLDEIAEAGYRGTELGPFGFLPKDAGLLKEELARRELPLIGATHVHTLGDPGSAPLLTQTLGELAPLLAELGARHL